MCVKTDIAFEEMRRVMKWKNWSGTVVRSGTTQVPEKVQGRNITTQYSATQMLQEQ